MIAWQRPSSEDHRDAIARPKGAVGPHTSWWRHLRIGASGALLVAAVVLVIVKSGDLVSAGHRLRHVGLWWVAAAVIAEGASMIVFAMLQRRLLRAGGVRIPMTTMTAITVAANAVTGTLPGGVVWSATWLFNQLGRRGVNRFVRGWMFLVAGGISSFALFVVVAVGTETAGNRGPVSSLRWLVFLLALVPIAGLVLEVLHKLGVVSSEQLESVRSVVGSSVDRTRLGHRLIDATHSIVRRASALHLGARGWIEVFSLALLNWLFDAAVVIAALFALGVPVPWRAILVIYGLTQISASFPITPAGVGIVAGSLTALLTAYGVPLTPALAVVILYRILSFWILVPIGWVIWAVLEIQTRQRGVPAADAFSAAPSPMPPDRSGPADIDGLRVVSGGSS